MKIKNAPERKRQRQLIALDSLQIRISKRPDKVQFSQEWELNELIRRTPSNLRNVRTKKRRGVPGR